MMVSKIVLGFFLSNVRLVGWARWFSLTSPTMPLSVRYCGTLSYYYRYYYLRCRSQPNIPAPWILVISIDPVTPSTTNDGISGVSCFARTLLITFHNLTNRFIMQNTLFHCISISRMSSFIAFSDILESIWCWRSSVRLVLLFTNFITDLTLLMRSSKPSQ